MDDEARDHAQQQASAGPPAAPARTLAPGASPISGVAPPEHTRWPKGVSGNPSGRPVRKPFTDTLREVLEANDGKRLRSIVEAWVADLENCPKQRAALLGETLNRVEGKVTDVLEASVKNTSKVVVLRARADGGTRDSSPESAHAVGEVQTPSGGSPVTSPIQEVNKPRGVPSQPAATEPPGEIAPSADLEGT
jgi:hypothetical protein